MLKNYFLVAYRNLKKHKTFSTINIIGFAIGISVCLLIVLFLIKEYSYDSYNTNADNIYKLIDVEENSSGIDYRVASAIVYQSPEVSNACFVQVLPIEVGTSYDNNGFNIDNIMSASNSFFKMFTTHFIYGNPEKPMPNLNSVVLTESSARKIFGEENPLGKEINLMRNFPLTVTGVIKDFPDNSTINANLIVNMENKNFKFSFSCADGKDSSTYRYPFNIYLTLKENSDPVQFVQKVNSNEQIIYPYVKKAGLISLTDTYLSDNTSGSTTKKGNHVLINLFTAIALIILLLAIFNYVNLSIARQNKRNKETGIRKTVGAGKVDIVLLFLIESVFVTIIAFVISLLIVKLALPFFENIVESHLSIAPILKFPSVIFLISSILLIGIISGIVPALLFSAFNPVTILSGRIINFGGKNYFRNILTLFQFTVSVGLIFCIIVIQRQIGFVKHNSLGFEKEQLVRIKIPFADSKDVAAFRDKLNEYPSILDISLTNGVPGNISFTMGSGVEGKEKYFSCIAADSNFFKTFKIQLVKGREMIPGDYGRICIINETAYKYLGWDNLNNKRYNNGREGGFEVIGIAKDFHTSSLHQAIEPACILLTPQFSFSNISIRMKKGTTGQTLAFLQKEWKGLFPDYPFDFQFYDEWFNRMYEKDERFANAIGMFGFIAISISCLGIFGLAIFSSERRAKEIGVRKIHGASINDLMILLNADFIKWIFLAFLFAFPLGWYAMNIWLQNFAYRTEISWWIFVLSAVTGLGIALLSVSWQTWSAATANPVISLRNE